MPKIVEPMRVLYQEVNVKTVMDFYADGFQPKEGEKLHKSDWFFDQSRGIVIFKLYVEEKKDG